MAINIGPKIGIDGEAAFRNEIKNIAQQLKAVSYTHLTLPTIA